MVTPAHDLLRRVLLFRELGDDMLDRLAAHLHRRAYRSATIVCDKDQPGDAMYIIESGRVRIFVPAQGGEELTLDHLGPGDVFGEMALLDGLPRSASAVTVEDSVLFMMSRDTFQLQLAESPQLASALLAMLSMRMRRLIEYTETLAFLDVYGRVAHVLLDMADRHGVQKDGGVLIDLAITQAELATMIGATRERVNRALAAFRAQGLIHMRGRKIVIRDARRLRDRIY
jgi:CRP/FNR family transcriptional regulator/CRP/FNR family cyclic AMP-dependent transcriptional regulator